MSHYETCCPSCGGSDEQGCHGGCPREEIPLLRAKLAKARVVLLWISLQRFSDRLTVTPENAFVAFQHLNRDSRAIMDRAATALKEISE